MKKELISPNQYKANLHCHSRYSDGKLTVEQLKTLYKSRGYSIVAFTDHEHLVDNSALEDDGFLPITSCEIAVKQYPDFSTLVKTDMKVTHLNFYAKDPHNIKTPCYNSVYDHFQTDAVRDKIVRPCEYRREYSREGISEIIRTANSAGFLVSYNHPRWSLENATDYLGYRGLWAVEIYNNSCNCGGLYEYDIGAYDDFLRSGENLVPLASDDNHNREVPGDSFGGFTMICADRFDYPSVIRAMENHNLYASTGPIIRSLTIDGDLATLTFDGELRATISTAGRRAESITADGKAIFRILGSDGFVRFDLIDTAGHRANTPAYFIRDIM